MIPMPIYVVLLFGIIYMLIMTACTERLKYLVALHCITAVFTGLMIYDWIIFLRRL